MQEYTPKVVKRRLSQLKLFDGNPRINDDAAARLMEVISEYGYLQLIAIDAQDTIVAGETRYKAIRGCANGGDPVVSCILADHLDPPAVRRWRLLDNKAAEWAPWDDEKLHAQLEQIRLEAPDIDMGQYGFSFTALAEGMDFSAANQELALDEGQEYVVKLKYTEERYGALKDRLNTLGEAPEDFFYNAVMAHVPV